MTVKTFGKFIEKFAESLKWTTNYNVNVCSYVTFNKDFGFYKTRTTTLSIDSRIFISFDESENNIEFYDTKYNVWDSIEKAFDFYNMKDYNDIHVTMLLMKKIESRLNEE